MCGGGGCDLKYSVGHCIWMLGGLALGGLAACAARQKMAQATGRSSSRGDIRGVNKGTGLIGGWNLNGEEAPLG